MITGMADPLLTVEGVWRHYGVTPALRGVSVAVGAGELFGLLGPNGAGKTSLLSLLAGLADPTEGHVTLFGERLTTRTPELRRHVGLATQDLAIYPDLTARENLWFFGRLYGMGGTDLSTRVDDMLAAVALSDRAGDRAGTFSGGMKRRLNLAAAVLHRPKLLLLDEPTAGVDPQSRNHIFEQVRALNAAGLTVIYTSHYMEEVQTLCPRLAILDHGKVVACDTLPALLTRLDTAVTLTLTSAPPGLIAALSALPGVTRCEPVPGGLRLHAPDPTPLLPRVLAACAAAAGAAVAGLAVDAPNLERVFQALTGEGLRD